MQDSFSSSTSLRKTFQNTASHYKKEKISCIRILQHLHTASHYKEKEKKRHVLEWLNKQLESIFTNTFTNIKLYKIILYNMQRLSIYN